MGSNSCPKSEEIIESGKINKLASRKYLFSKVDESQRNKRKRINHFESMRLRSNLLSQNKAIFSLPTGITEESLNSETPGFDDNIHPLHNNLLSRAPVYGCFPLLNMKAPGNTHPKKDISNMSLLGGDSISNIDLATINLMKNNSSIKRRILTFDKEQQLATILLDSQRASNPTNNLEEISHDRESTPYFLALENHYQRVLKSSLLNQYALLLSRQERMDRLECSPTALISSLPHTLTNYPLLYHRSSLEGSNFLDNTNILNQQKLTLQAGINQDYLNAQMLSKESAVTSEANVTISDGYDVIGLNNNTETKENKIGFASQHSFNKPRTTSMKLAHTERMETSILLLCHDGTVSHFSKRRCVPLAADEDENWLSEFFCFIRSELVEIFRANNDDIASRINNKSIVFGQVGIRCRFCAHLTHRGRSSRSSCFPSSLDRIYQSMTMMIRDHFLRCHTLPNELKTKFITLKSQSNRGAIDSKKYWVKSAKQLGMVDTTPNQGIMVTEASITAIQS
mmetsp:Transcript_1188/g.1364  ORF Transcript_1188/g.1364 Transcript_1188/m.1364 type:complete len:512 (+) Transcript_1188:363-1898(+)